MKKWKVEQRTSWIKNYACVYFRYSVRSAFEFKLMDNGQEQTFVLAEKEKITSVRPW
jgi:hypothetical protein